MQRLDDDAAMLLLEGAHFVEVAGDQGRRHILRVIEHIDFLRRVADGDRIVHDKSLALDPFEQMGRGDIADVERRVLTHQHNINIAAKIELQRVAECIMIAQYRPHRHRMGRRGQAAIGVQGQALHIIMEYLVTAFLRGEHQREAAVSGDIHAFHRVHLYSDFQGHVYSLDIFEPAYRSCRA